VEEPRQHYVVAVKRHERPRFLIWFSDDQDGLVTAADDGSLLAFESDGDARGHAGSAGLAVSEEESAYFDFDELEAWIGAPNPFRMRPDDLLNAWNLLRDIASSVRNQVAAAKLRNRGDKELYLRLVNSCDIPALRSPTVERPTPEDCAAIAAVLRHGLACFDAALPAPGGVSPPAPARR
jgi:hypothetical protein